MTRHDDGGMRGVSRKHKVGHGEPENQERTRTDPGKEGKAILKSMPRKPQLDTPGNIKDHAGLPASTERRANTATNAEKKGAEREGSHFDPCGEQRSVAPEDTLETPSQSVIF